MTENHHSKQLSASHRTETTRSSLHELRDNGGIPGVVYGTEGENLMISVESKDLVKFLRTGRSEFFQLQVENEGYPVLIKEVQKQGGKIIHVDFQHVSKNKPIRVKVPLHIIGTAIGTEAGGVLQVQANDLEVEGLPDALPPSLEIDVASLGIGDKLLAGDVQLPQGISLIADTEELIASVIQTRGAEAADEEDVANETPAESEE
ncbi:large subunit ribosomal protein L25 [Fontibacillus solani]|uniref:Large ribosomal subunit protein bL25 n=1 Tax=Fontibacillus solani TaxID=1572857 RepID=A0A7W3XSV4_9BACL|nr:50S ribosomal protein L25 [Fontibacillus solani]MBA9086946.1 large subunit ribosomal protein L25 [Fontibacillus solani]